MRAGVVTIGKPFPRHGGFNAALKKINQLKQAMPEHQGLGMIDDFRLWGSRRCRQTDTPPTKPRWRVQVARAFNNRNAFLSEGGPLAVVV